MSNIYCVNAVLWTSFNKDLFQIKLFQMCDVQSPLMSQPIPDREGKRCLFCVKTHNKTYEMSASDQRQKVEWIQGTSKTPHANHCLLANLYFLIQAPYLPPLVVQTALRLQSESRSSLHQELKLKRRVQREHSQRERSRSARSSCSSQSEDSNTQEMEKMEKDRQDLEIESIIQVSGEAKQERDPNSLHDTDLLSHSMHVNWKPGEGRQRRRRGGNRGRCRWSSRDS